MSWNCKISEERLSEYLDSKLMPEESAAFLAHVGSCANCTRLLVQVKGLVGSLHKLEEIEVPPNLADKILDATLGVRGWRRWFTWVPVLWQPRFAMGLVTVAASLTIVIHSTRITPGKIKRADLSPANIFRSANRQVHLTYARSAKFVNDLRVVYEIQSRLQPPPEPSPNSAPAPEQKQSQPDPSTPQQKSDKNPPQNRSQVHAGGMFAVLMPADLPVSTIATLTRSPR